MDTAPLPDDWTHALVVAAHPDDIEYGTAAAVAGWTAAGKRVSYLLVTRGEAGIATTAPEEAGPLREAEERRSAAVVGVEGVRFLDHRDGVVVEGPDLRRDIAREIRRVRPDLVVAMNHRESWGRPGSWNSADHRAVGRSVIDAVGDADNRWIFPELVAEGFEPWHGVRRTVVVAPTAATATHHVDVADTLETAVASLSEHRLYLAALSDEPVEAQARATLTAILGDEPRLWLEVFG